MKQLNFKQKKGFTIIEVVLVLAIAGLIFLMVFTALPALQRSQRDTQRNDDLSRMSAALTNYSGSNRGRIPTVGKTVLGAEEKQDIQVDGTAYTTTNSDTKSWGYFYADYMLVGSGGATDTFTDPDGEPYSLIISDCMGGQKGTAGTECTVGQRQSLTWDQQATGEYPNDAKNVGPNTSKLPYAISVVTHATCDGELAKYSPGARKVAILYKKEGGGTFCFAN